MTRFARSKGSKASNEKVREDSTPWQVMKQQLEVSLNKENPENKEKTKTARQLLEEKERSDPVSNNWAEFDAPKKSKEKLPVSTKIQKSNEKKKKKKKLQGALKKETIINPELLQDVSEKIKKQKPDENQKSKKSEEKVESSENQLESSPKKKKRSKVDTPAQDQVPEKKQKSESSEKSEEKPKTTEKLSKRQKRNLKKKNQNLEAANKEKLEKKSVFDTKENDWESDVKFGKPDKIDKKPEEKPEENSKNDFHKENHFGKFERQRPHKKNHHLRKPKIKNDQEHKRRKPVQSSKMIINGIEVEVMMYDGFPVQKEDAERLKELKQQMILKGIPKSEIDAAMKLERRKAEKALARVRKQVCFHCRKAGHNMSDCPELDREETATGICFKCGSTEHTHFECKVTKSDDYRYAKCFICREQGHVAKQCPDNPKGLYPKGGACKICGDVTHLKKDCPDSAREKEETTITVKTIQDSALESIDDEGVKVEPKKSKKKIVKF